MHPDFLGHFVSGSKPVAGGFWGTGSLACGVPETGTRSELGCVVQKPEIHPGRLAEPAAPRQLAGSRGRPIDEDFS